MSENEDSDLSQDRAVWRGIKRHNLAFLSSYFKPSSFILTALRLPSLLQQPIWVIGSVPFTGSMDQNRQDRQTQAALQPHTLCDAAGSSKQTAGEGTGPLGMAKGTAWGQWLGTG